jgi:DNA-binding transcriptional MerR regulator
MIIIMTADHSTSERGQQTMGQPASVPQIHSKRFDTKEAAAVAGIDVGKLQNWLTRELIQLKCELNPGRGQSREYTPYEIARIRLMIKLADVGVPLSTAFKLTDALKKAWEQVPGGHELYGSEPQLKSWLLVLPAAAWPAGRKASTAHADDYIAVWLVDQQKKPDDPRGLKAALVALSDAAVVVINMGAFLNVTMSRLARLLEDG